MEFIHVIVFHQVQGRHQHVHPFLVYKIMNQHSEPVCQHVSFVVQVSPLGVAVACWALSQQATHTHTHCIV